MHVLVEPLDERQGSLLERLLLFFRHVHFSKLGRANPALERTASPPLNSALGVLMRHIYSGAFFLILGSVMLGASLYGVISGQALFLARRGGTVLVEQATQPTLFWFVVLFCAVGGGITTIFGRRLFRGAE